MKAIKKPIEVEVYQTDKPMDIKTLEGTMHANVGDYIITGVNGEQYPCAKDIFEKTYTIVDITECEYCSQKISRQTAIKVLRPFLNEFYHKRYKFIYFCSADCIRKWEKGTNNERSRKK